MKGRLLSPFKSKHQEQNSAVSWLRLSAAVFLPWPVPFRLRVYLPQEVEISTFFQPLNAFVSQNIFSLIFLTNLEAIKCPTKRSAEAPSLSGAKATEKNPVVSLSA